MESITFFFPIIGDSRLIMFWQASGKKHSKVLYLSASFWHTNTCVLAFYVYSSGEDAFTESVM